MIRDYIKEPLGYIRQGSVLSREKPLKEDLYELYIIENKSINECSKYFNYNKRMLQNILKEYGIKKDRKQVYELQKQTLLKTKGVENVFQLEEIKSKIEQTNIEKYGVKSYVKTEDYKIKNIATRKEKYGEDLFQREKYKQTCLKKWGVENVNYIHFSEEQMKFENSKEYTNQFIKDNNIQSALEFSEKSGIKLYASLTLLHKYDLMKDFPRFTSREEKEIQDYIMTFGINFIPHYKMKSGKEIDIYIPSLNFGIEYNGDYWHCEVFRDEKYHLNKSMEAMNEGIFIYHIFGYEWKSIKDKIKNQLKNLLKNNSEKIYARKCIIQEVNRKDKREFLEKNHIQGNDHSLYYYGLYYNNELVSLMTFSKPHNTNKIEWELSRFCSKAGCNVIGGANKLFKYFIKEHNPQTVISYSNIAHTKGLLYETLGFEHTHNSKPSYVWIGNNDIKTRYQTRAKRLKEMGYEGTEISIMHSLGYSQLFDCGNKVWVWKSKE